MRFPDVLIAIAAAGALLAVGIQIGRDVERINALAAMPASGKKIIGKAAAWNRVYGPVGMRPSSHRAGEDLRLPELRAER